METDRPNRIPWPPLIYLAAAAAGIALGQALPLPWPGLPLRMIFTVLGIAMCAFAVVLDLNTFRAFRSHNTTVLPHRAASRLITTGPFARSRNPIYLSNTVLLAGIGLAFAKPWLVVLAPVAALLTQKLAIEREERHLAAKFGDEWHAYAARVRRWL